MRFKVGDRVRIKSIDWYNENKGNADKSNSVWCEDGGAWFFYHMSQYCGKIMTIEHVWSLSYTLEGSDSRWTDEMIECKVKEEVGLVDNLSSRWVNEFELPDGYIFKDENGNVINATKIVLEKKKEYPKTYEECYKIMGVKLSDCYIQGYKSPLLEDLQELLICRDAYWKIAGEEMGLEKPWEPDWNDEKQDTYGLYNEVKYTIINPAIFLFPTEEMRDVFYENFKELIKSCRSCCNGNI